MSPQNSAEGIGAEAQEVAAAAERLLAGTPIRSSGRPSIVALADEAGLKRTRLYEHHREQVDAFTAKIGNGPTAPGTVRPMDQLGATRARIAELESEAALQAETIRTLMATVVELSLQLHPDTNVLPMKTT